MPDISLILPRALMIASMSFMTITLTSLEISIKSGLPYPSAVHGREVLIDVDRIMRIAEEAHDETRTGDLDLILETVMVWALQHETLHLGLGLAYRREMVIARKCGMDREKCRRIAMALEDSIINSFLIGLIPVSIYASTGMDIYRTAIKLRRGVARTITYLYEKSYNVFDLLRIARSLTDREREKLRNNVDEMLRIALNVKSIDDVNEIVRRLEEVYRILMIDHTYEELLIDALTRSDIELGEKLQLAYVYSTDPDMMMSVCTALLNILKLGRLPSRVIRDVERQYEILNVRLNWWKILIYEALRGHSNTLAEWSAPSTVRGVPGDAHVGRRALVMVDTSGSITMRELSLFMSFLRQLEKRARINMTYIFWGGQPHGPYDRVDNVQIVGMSGTVIRPALELAVEIARKRRFDMLIVLTDSKIADIDEEETVHLLRKVCTRVRGRRLWLTVCERPPRHVEEMFRIVYIDFTSLEHLNEFSHM